MGGVQTKFSAKFEEATQQAQEDGDESAGTVDPDVVWRQNLSEPYKNRVYEAGGFFVESLRTFGYRGSCTSSASTQAGPASNTEVVYLREKIQNLTQSLECKSRCTNTQEGG
ncbi:hypothetical protein PIB30_060665 [Stylosanthes scabra]|uniref:Uncharacterized protein n=1 Tax=Stylosanthes scabra TaxID=79078 RepID=A0ABU6XKE7_9FABA|nr:hypothetical protein [Stylosanthes scabra]